jgi:hypothetical protein
VIRWPSTAPTENDHVCSSARTTPSASCSACAVMG